MEELYKPSENENIEIYNTESTDMLGDMPGWLIHTGSYVVYGLLALLVVTAMLFRYPDTVETSVRIDDMGSVEWITAARTGIVDRFLVDDQSEVREGDTLALLKNDASLEDVKYFCLVLTGVEEYYRSGQAKYLQNYPFNLIMGEMSQAYTQFTEAVRTCLMYDEFDLYPKKRHFLEEEYELLCEAGKADALTRLKVKQELFELDISHRMEQARNRRMLELAYESMVNSLQSWDKQNLIKAGTNGQVVWGESWSIGRRVTEGDTICTVVSHRKGKPTGHIRIGESQMAGIAVGDRVNVALNKYPSHTYGTLTGRVESMSYVPSNKNYALEVEFPNGLVTTTGYKVACDIGLSGRAEILTADRSVLSRIFAPLRSLME